MDRKTTVWPAYLDAGRSRKDGRKLAKKRAVESPTVKRIHEAAEKLGLRPESEKDKTYPKEPHESPGRVLVERKGTKLSTLKAIAKEMRKER